MMPMILSASGGRRDAYDRAPGLSSAPTMEQEFIVGGYIPGARGFDALLVGVYKNKRLTTTARVKNGFVPRVREEIFPALKAM
jgi:hypothetical protein